jgi:hypothetical protein
LAQEKGAQVVAVDSDHGAIERLLDQPVPGLHPVLANLDDVSGGRGWSGTEFQGLAQRWTGRLDLVMMLALTHHLAIGCAVPLGAIAQFAARVTKRWLVIELLSTDDPQVRQLLAQRQRAPADFEVSMQRQAFSDAGFKTVHEVRLPSGHRTLCLMELTRSC